MGTLNMEHIQNSGWSNRLILGSDDPVAILVVSVVDHLEISDLPRSNALTFPVFVHHDPAEAVRVVGHLRSEA